MKILESLNFGVNEVLQRKEMINVLGGGGLYCSEVEANSVASFEEESGCLTAEQYNYAYNYCMNY